VRVDAAEPPPWVDAEPPDVASAAAPTPAPAPAASVLQPTALGEMWTEVVSSLVQQGAIAALVRELAMQAELLEQSSTADGAIWRLRVEREALRAPALRDKLQAALAAATDGAVALELIAGVALDSPALREAVARARAQQAAEQTIQGDPVVRDLMAQFKTARIVPGSIKPVSRNTAS
jgi:DNA polymerase III subunit gamma/tau